MAAGMGSRYGGLKQLDSFGPNNETIIDYSVYDAIESGFEKIVFIIREEFSKDFKTKISDKFKDRINVEHVYQSLDYVPKSFPVPNIRKKPWGTGHAILCAKKAISGPFIAINGDDFYGRQSFQVASNFYQNEETSKSFLEIDTSQINKEFIYFSYVEDGVLDSRNVRGRFRGSKIIKIQKYFNKIDFVALNQGESGPNTAEVRVFDDKGKLVGANRWNLATGVKSTYIIVKEN